MFKKDFKNVYVVINDYNVKIGNKKALEIKISSFMDGYTQNSILVSSYVKTRDLNPESHYNLLHADKVDIEYNEYGIQCIEIDGLFLVKEGKPSYSEFYNRDKYCLTESETLAELFLTSEDYLFDISYEEILNSFKDNLKKKGKRLLENAKISLKNQDIKIEKRDRKSFWNRWFIKNKI